MNTKLCTLCSTVKARSEFADNDQHPDGLDYRCRACKAAYDRSYRKRNRAKRNEHNRAWHRAHPTAKRKDYVRDRQKVILNGCRRRAEKCGLPFNLELADIEVPTHCSALGVPLSIGKKGAGASWWHNTPSVDRIIPELGYVKGNIVVISRLANTIKNCGTPEQVRAVADWLERAHPTAWLR